MQLQNFSARTLSVAALLIASSAFGQKWTDASTGIPSAVPYVSALTIDAAAPSTIYATTSDGRLFKTTDGAGSWRLLSNIAGVFRFVLDPSDPLTLYAATNRGILKSTNGGESWSGANAGLTLSFVGNIVIDPVTPSTLYAWAFQGFGGFLFKSTDGGANWGALDRGPRDILTLVVDPTTPSNIYATSVDPRSPQNPQILKSTDGGENWGSLNIDLSLNFCVPLAVAPTAPATLYAGCRDPVTRTAVLIQSIDGGKGWNIVNATFPERTAIVTITIDPSDPSTVYLVYNYPGPRVGITRSTDAAASWNVIYDAPFDRVFPPIAIDPATPSTLYIGGPGGVRKTSSGGADWQVASDGLIDFDIRILVPDPVNPAVVYTGGRDGILKSADRGASWSNLVKLQLPAPSFPPPLSPPPFGAGPAHTRSLQIDFANPNVLYALTFRPNGCAFSDKLLFKSVDGGATWTDNVSPPSTGCILGDLMVMDPTNPNTLYLSAFNEGATSLLKSTNAGAAWNDIWGRDTFVQALVIDHSNPAILFAGLGDTSESPVNGVVKSVNGGVSWTNAGLTGSAVTLIAMSASDSRTLYASTEGFYTEPRGFRGLYKSTDSGTSWFAINEGLEELMDTRTRISALVINPRNPNILYAGTAGSGIFRSTDGGATWSPFNDRLSDLNIRLMAFAPHEPATLYAGTPSGVFRIVDDKAQASTGR
ncbi:MAG: hypothetical protein HY820_28725 [Acidobacteria bacterium]|nr:hypothetical protein [Acidobacteriota bacterium]